MPEKAGAASYGVWGHQFIFILLFGCTNLHMTRATPFINQYPFLDSSSTAEICLNVAVKSVKNLVIELTSTETTSTC